MRDIGTGGQSLSQRHVSIAQRYPNKKKGSGDCCHYQTSWKNTGHKDGPIFLKLAALLRNKARRIRNKCGSSAQERSPHCGPDVIVVLIGKFEVENACETENLIPLEMWSYSNFLNCCCRKTLLAHRERRVSFHLLPPLLGQSRCRLCVMQVAL